MYRKTVMSSAFKGWTREQPWTLHLSKKYQGPGESLVAACICNTLAGHKTSAKGNFICMRHPECHMMVGVIRWSQIIPLGKKIWFFFNFSKYVFQWITSSPQNFSVLRVLCMRAELICLHIQIIRLNFIKNMDRAQVAHVHATVAKNLQWSRKELLSNKHYS